VAVACGCNYIEQNIEDHAASATAKLTYPHQVLNKRSSSDHLISLGGWDDVISISIIALPPFPHVFLHVEGPNMFIMLLTGAKSCPYQPFEPHRMW
jgi:hypothetical protein